MNQGQALPVSASLVSKNNRLSFLPRFFGPRLMMKGEALVYAWMRRLSKDYSGGLWNFYVLSNGGFYMAPEAGRMRVSVEGNWFDGEMSADAAGATATMFTLGQLAAEDERMGDLYHLLREFIHEHAEASVIFRAID